MEIFRLYLHSIPDDLLRSVTEDYVWLTGLTLNTGRCSGDFLYRRECCREECARRGFPQMFELAQNVVSARAA